MSGLVLDGSGNLYGTTTAGGDSDNGTIYTLKTDGSGFEIRHSFAGPPLDGIQPQSRLVLDGSGNLYGTTRLGGLLSQGTVFRMTTNGATYVILRSLSTADGTQPIGSLTFDSTYLYGTTYMGGATGAGTVFKVQTTGVGFLVVHNLAGAFEGGNPYGGVALDGTGNLYGTASVGGAFGGGTLFKMQANGASFEGLHGFGCLDGMDPKGGLVADGTGRLYGTTLSGGSGESSHSGAVFAMNPNGTVYTVLHSFLNDGTEGIAPEGSLALDGSDNVYGTTSAGGFASLGTIFTMKTNGTGFTLLHAFAGGTSDGGQPRGGLVIDASGTLYGTTYQGGATGFGTVFSLSAGGTFSILHSFKTTAGNSSRPRGELILDRASGYLYGTTEQGGVSGLGAVYKVSTTGSGFLLLHSFAGGTSDGATPYGGLLLSSGTLYGTTRAGGASDLGTVFKVSTTGTGFLLLHSFSGGATDGSLPSAGLTLDVAGNHLFGTTSAGGTSNKGAVFTQKLNGAGFELMHSFTGAGVFPDGSSPAAGLLLDAAGNLYGNTEAGGPADGGTEFTLRAWPTATVSGDATLSCAGDSTMIQADLTGMPPWDVTWSDGMTQSGVMTTPVTRSVSPSVTTPYTVSALTDSVEAGTSSGSAMVTVMPDVTQPTVTAPSAATIRQTTCS